MIGRPNLHPWLLLGKKRACNLPPKLVTPCLQCLSPARACIIRSFHHCQKFSSSLFLLMNSCLPVVSCSLSFCREEKRFLITPSLTPMCIFPQVTAYHVMHLLAIIVSRITISRSKLFVLGCLHAFQSSSFSDLPLMR